jgi:ABC-type proline/glycine betaine transport system substrate-binding protein
VKACRRLLNLWLFLAVGALAAGCGGLGAVSGGKELNAAGTDMIIGIEPGAAFHPQIKDKVIPGYDLDAELVESSTPAMLSELEKAYEMREPIVFLG